MSPFGTPDHPPADPTAAPKARGLSESDGRLKAAVAGFQEASTSRAAWQFASSLGGFVAICAAMYASYGLSYGLTLGLAVLAAGFVVRLFIIQHDCGHGSFLASARANAMLGRFCGMITFTPYANWRRQHAGHHAVWNNLDRRENADLYSNAMTLLEYEALPPWRRVLYRVTHHPVVTGLLLPPLVFLLLYRVPFDTPRRWRRERWSVHATNAGIGTLFLGLGLLFGFQRVLWIHLPIIVMAAIAGAWLFAVQHRFEEALWQRDAAWDPRAAALQGSSYLKLPAVLQWITGNIGFHHIHHLNPRVPNYRLPQCHRAVPELQAVPTLGIRGALGAPFFALWDEDEGRMVSFRTAHRKLGLRAAGGSATAGPASLLS